MDATQLDKQAREALLDLIVRYGNSRADEYRLPSLALPRTRAVSAHLFVDIVAALSTTSEPQRQARLKAQALADEWRHVLTDGSDGHHLCANQNTVARFVNAIDAMLAEDSL